MAEQNGESFGGVAPRWLVAAIGLLVGSLMCCSNMYFGLQTGFISMMSIQSAILGYGAFRLIQRRWIIPFNVHDNVLLQTISVAAATLPLAAGFVGIIPALAMLNEEESDEGDAALSKWWQQILWGFAVVYVGVFAAVPLRRQVILREQLKFPSGTATAKVLETIHANRRFEEAKEEHEELNAVLDPSNAPPHMGSVWSPPLDINTDEKAGSGAEAADWEGKALLSVDEVEKEWAAKWRVMFVSFAVSSVYTLVSYFFPFMYRLPVFSWIGLDLFTEWQWVLTPSFSYVGQGMIMGQRSAVSMFVGALVGWAILGPSVQIAGWCDEVIGVDDGCSGWIMWVSLSIMIGESLMSLAILVGVMVYVRIRYSDPAKADEEGLTPLDLQKLEAELDPAPLAQQVSTFMWVSGLLASCAVCWAIVVPLVNMEWYEPPVALIMSLLTAVLAVRALGETDLNPVSGIGKLSQILFGFVAPGDLVANIVAGGIAEAAAQQSGDLMQDLKTGHLLNASPRAQFFGQLLGSFFSIFISVGAFALYSSAYGVPSPEFPVPTAQIWLDMALLVNGGQLADNVLWFCVGGGILACVLPIIAFLHPEWKDFLPSAVAFAIGMYITPNYSLTRMIGSAVQYVWMVRYPISHEKYMLLAASGLVLGEGITSLVSASMAAAGVPQYPFHDSS